MDTRLGLQEGVPRLLELFRRYSVRASFFVTFGPDHSGRAIRRIFRPSFIAKMWRTNPFRLYGFKTLLAGTLLPSLPVGEGEPALLKDIVAEGHELGIHGYDHVRWQDQLDGMEEAEIETELTKAIDAYERIVGSRPVGLSEIPLIVIIRRREATIFSAKLGVADVLLLGSPMTPYRRGTKLNVAERC